MATQAVQPGRVQGGGRRDRGGRPPQQPRRWCWCCLRLTDRGGLAPPSERCPGGWGETGVVKAGLPLDGEGAGCARLCCLAATAGADDAGLARQGQRPWTLGSEGPHQPSNWGDVRFMGRPGRAPAGPVRPRRRWGRLPLLVLECVGGRGPRRLLACFVFEVWNMDRAQRLELDVKIRARHSNRSNGCDKGGRKRGKGRFDLEWSWS